MHDPSNGRFRVGINEISVSVADNTPGNVWSDITFLVPSICPKVPVLIQGNYIDQNSGLHWRKKGSTMSIGHGVAHVAPNIATPTIPMEVDVDSSGSIQVRYHSGGNNTVTAYHEGWFLPDGM